MTVKTTVTWQCDAPGCKNTFVFDKPGATRKAVRTAALKEGWKRKGSKAQFCQKHAPVKAAVSKKAKGSSSKDKKTGTSRKGTMAKAVTKRGIFEVGKRAENTETT